jgi:hypothetical protein
VNTVDLMVAAGEEVDEVVPIVAVKVSDANTNGSLTLIVTELMVSVLLVLLAIVKVPPATVSAGDPLLVPDLVTVTTAPKVGVGVAVGVGVGVGVAAFVVVAVAAGTAVAATIALEDPVGVSTNAVTKLLMSIVPHPVAWS